LRRIIGPVTASIVAAVLWQLVFKPLQVKKPAAADPKKKKN
jgi:hypothetical protein